VSFVSVHGVAAIAAWRLCSSPLGRERRPGHLGRVLFAFLLFINVGLMPGAH
jgi:hypothetical protein